MRFLRRGDEEAGTARLRPGAPSSSHLGDFLDALTRLAAEVCRAPMAFLASHDDSEPRLLSSFGPNLSDPSQALALVTDDLLSCELTIVLDTSAEERWATHPLVTSGPKIRFFASLPLRNSEGRVLGTLAVLDRTPRDLNPEQKTALEDLAQQAAKFMVLDGPIQELTSALVERRNSQEELGRLFDLSLDMLCVGGFDGYFKRLNPAWEKSLGYTQQELLSKPYLEFIHPDDREATRAAAQELVSGVHIVAFENRYLSKDGSYRWLMWNATPFADQQLIYAAARDVTDRKRAERRLSMQYVTSRALAESSTMAEAAPKILEGIGEALEWEHGALWRVDAREGVLRCVDVWHPAQVQFAKFEARSRRTTFRPGEGLPGRVWQSGRPDWITDVGHDANFPRATIALQEGLHGGFAFPIQLGGDTLGVMEFFSREIRKPDHELLKAMAAIGSQIGQFIERKQAEEDLKRYAQELESAKWFLEENAARLTQLVKELESAKHRAEDSTRAKSEFLASVSHEIRTPMTAIMGMTELALETRLTPQQREYLSTVRSSGESLLDLLNDILDLSKIEARRLELDRVEFNLREALEETMKALALRAHAKRLELACHIGPDVREQVVGDPARLRQVVINLVSNAVKFTEKGEVVLEVETQSLAPAETLLHFAVSDTGIGIPTEKHDLVFEAFTQADSSTNRKYGGTGLGLTISSQLVKLMGGKIWLESEVGQGSTFHFTACFGLGQASGEPLVPATPVNLENMPVLIVDDSSINRRIFDELLTRWRMRPTAVENGPKALLALEKAAEVKTPYPLALLDAHMPAMDGFQLAERIKKRRLLAPTRLILLTSAGNRKDAARCRELGIETCLTKPVKHSDLLDAIVKTVTFPLAGGRTPRPLRRRAKPLAPRLRILVAEDNPVNRKLTLHLLEGRGHTVAAVENGREVLRALAEENFDLLLLDLQMPEMDGYETTAALREREKAAGGHLPVIALTAQALEGERQRCLEAGMDGYLSKPIRAADLVKAVESAASARVGAGRAGKTRQGQPFDASAFSAMVGGNARLLKELVEIFLADSPKLMEQMEAALERKDADALRSAAHAFLSSVSTFAARSAFEAAQKLDTLAQEGDLSGARSQFRGLRREAARLLCALSRFKTGNLKSRKSARAPAQAARSKSKRK